VAGVPAYEAFTGAGGEKLDLRIIRGANRRRHPHPALRIRRHQTAGSDLEQPQAGPNGVEGREGPK